MSDRKNFYTDADLARHIESGAPGDRNAAPHLMTVPEDDRPMVVGEAHRRMNMEPGWNYSGAVRAECRLYNENPAAYRKAVADSYARTHECQAWARETGMIASLESYAGRPGDPIVSSGYSRRHF